MTTIIKRSQMEIIDLQNKIFKFKYNIIIVNIKT